MRCETLCDESVSWFERTNRRSAPVVVTVWVFLCFCHFRPSGDGAWLVELAWSAAKRDVHRKKSSRQNPKQGGSVVGGRFSGTVHCSSRERKSVHHGLPGRRGGHARGRCMFRRGNRQEAVGTPLQ